MSVEVTTLVVPIYMKAEISVTSKLFVSIFAQNHVGSC